ncbi:TetR/AcrR family transcriptional regulator [Oceanobacillus saliphilus]|uniref:TetR/AcrR family transcriptional regulator n=1 Tax=Oceanobacillus saliphilus TaxID=2925834 RepID=UPI0034D45742
MGHSRGVLWKKGFFDTSIIKITLKEGVAKGTFYYYFPTKKQLMISECSAYCFGHGLNVVQLTFN